jgi:hypothetical protein
MDYRMFMNLLKMSWKRHPTGGQGLWVLRRVEEHITETLTVRQIDDDGLVKKGAGPRGRGSENQ